MEVLKHGDILHCSGQRIISKGIKLFTKSEFSHTALFILINGEPFVIDAQKDGVNPRPFDKWVEKYNYKYISSSPEWEFDPLEKALSKSGTTGYDFELFALRYPSKIIKGLFTKKEVELRRVKNEGERMICSEFVAWVLGLENPQNYTPKDLYIYCMRKGW